MTRYLPACMLLSFAIACSVEELDTEMPPPPGAADVRVLLLLEGTDEADVFFAVSHGLPVALGNRPSPGLSGWTPVVRGDTSAHVSLGGRSLARSDHELREDRRYLLAVVGAVDAEEEQAPRVVWNEEVLRAVAEGHARVRTLLSPGLGVASMFVGGASLEVADDAGTVGVSTEVEAGTTELEVTLEGEAGPVRFRDVLLPEDAHLTLVLFRRNDAFRLLVIDDPSSEILGEHAAEGD